MSRKSDLEEGRLAVSVANRSTASVAVSLDVVHDDSAVLVSLYHPKSYSMATITVLFGSRFAFVDDETDQAVAEAALDVDVGESFPRFLKKLVVSCRDTFAHICDDLAPDVARTRKREWGRKRDEAKEDERFFVSACAGALRATSLADLSAETEIDVRDNGDALDAFAFLSATLLRIPKHVETRRVNDFLTDRVFALNDHAHRDVEGWITCFHGTTYDRVYPSSPRDLKSSRTRDERKTAPRSATAYT